MLEELLEPVELLVRLLEAEEAEALEAMVDVEPFATLGITGFPAPEEDDPSG